MDSGIDRITRPIDTLCADDAGELVSQEIEELERRLAKLKQIRKVLGGKSARGLGVAKRWAVDEKLEAKVVSLVKKNGPMKSSDLAMKIPGVTALAIGRLVSASRLLVRNDEKLVEVREDDK